MVTNQEYIDAINKTLAFIEKVKDLNTYSMTEPKINFGLKRLCTECLTSYVGGPVCDCGNRYTSEL